MGRCGRIAIVGFCQCQKRLCHAICGAGTFRDLLSKWGQFLSDGNPYQLHKIFTVGKMICNRVNGVRKSALGNICTRRKIMFFHDCALQYRVITSWKHTSPRPKGGHPRRFVQAVGTISAPMGLYNHSFILRQRSNLRPRPTERKTTCYACSLRTTGKVSNFSMHCKSKCNSVRYAHVVEVIIASINVSYQINLETGQHLPHRFQDIDHIIMTAASAHYPAFLGNRFEFLVESTGMGWIFVELTGQRSVRTAIEKCRCF